MSVKSGIKNFGQMKVTKSTTFMRCTIASEERQILQYRQKESLRYLMFIKEKMDGTIEAKGCADGRSQ